jgi:Na+/proline symporter
MYTSQGGLKAVVWTDAIQSVFTIMSIVAVIVLGFIQVGGFSNAIKANIEGDRIELFRYLPHLSAVLDLGKKNSRGALMRHTNCASLAN